MADIAIVPPFALKARNHLADQREAAGALVPDGDRLRLSRRLPAAAADRGVRPGVQPRSGQGLGNAGRPRHAVGDLADLAGRGHRGAAQPGVRRRRRLGDRQVRIQGQGFPDHADRPAVLGVAGDLGPGLRAAVRRRQLARTVAQGAWRRDPVRRAGHRAGHHLRHLPVRGARIDPADAGTRHRRRGGGAVARRQRLADLLVRDAAQHPLGPALWRAALQRPRHGRVRRGVGGVGPHTRPHQHHAAACRNPLQRVQCRRGLLGRRTAGRTGARHARAEDIA